MHHTQRSFSDVTDAAGYAQVYREMGLPVFPVCRPVRRGCMHHGPDCDKPGKRPLIKWAALQDAVPSSGDVEFWWRKWRDANIGMATGRLSGVVVVDIDGPHAMALAEDCGIEPGPRVTTGKVGGLHLWHAYRDDAPTVFTKSHGIDFRGHGGYVLLPPSRHELGLAYTWLGGYGIDLPLPALPRWVDALAWEPDPGRGHASGHTLRPGEALDLDALLEYGVAEGTRDDTLFRVAAKLRGDDWPYNEALAVVLRIAARCQPPFPSAEARRKVDSAWKYEPNPPPIPAGTVGRRKRQAVEPEAEPVDWRMLQAPIPDPPIDVLPAACQAVIASSSLPAELLMGALGAALDTAIGGVPEVHYGTERQRAITWTPLVGPSGSGKSPAMGDAFGPFTAVDRERRLAYAREMADYKRRLEEAHDKATFKQSEPEPVLRTKHIEDATPEALATDLAEYRSRGVWFDELKGLVTLMGEYKTVRAADEARLLRLWTGSDYVMRRKTDKTRLYVQAPTVVICGPLTLDSHRLLGQAGDGMRARWMPHIARPRLPVEKRPASQEALEGWERLLRRLLDREEEVRYWVLDDDAKAAYREYERYWQAILVDGDPPKQVEVALAKADTHLLRLSLRLAEAEAWAVSDRMVIGRDIVDRAFRWVDYCLGCWWAMPEGEVLSLGRVSEKIDARLDEVQAYIESARAMRHLVDGWLPGMLLRRNAVAGIHTSEDARAVLRRWQARYPSAFEERPSPNGGAPAVFVRSPRRSGLQ